MLQENTLTESREYKRSFPVKNVLICFTIEHSTTCSKTAREKPLTRFPIERGSVALQWSVES